MGNVAEKPKRKRLSGKVMSDAAVELAHQRGYIVAHFTNVQDARGFYRTSYAYDAKGFPDLILVGPKFIAIEVKGEGDTLTDDQKGWILAFELVGLEAHVLTPKMFREGWLEANL